jgi:hypothetical protein
MGWKKLMLILLFVLALAIPAHSADKVGMFGAPNSSGVGPMEVDSDRIVTIAADAGMKYAYEVATTSDTLTAAESGKTISVAATNAGGNYVTLTLPTAAVGMQFTAIADTKTTIYLDPAVADTIRYGSAVFAAGDKIGNSSAATGDSITLFCPVANYWSVKSLVGTWADSN